MSKLKEFFRGMEYDEHGKIIPVDKMSPEVLKWWFVFLALIVVAFFANRMLGALM